MKDCIGEVLKYLEEKKKEGNPRDVLKSLSRVLIPMARGQVAFGADFKAKADALLKDLFEEYAKKEQAAKKLALYKLGNHWVRPLMEAKARGSSVAETLPALIHGGGMRAGRGVNLASRSDQRFLREQLQLMLAQILEPHRGLLAGDTGADFRREIYRAKYAVDRDGPKPEGVTDPAWQIAKGVKQLQAFLYSLKKADNPWLTKADNYLFGRIWNNDKITGVSKEEFVKDAEKWAFAKSFPGATPEQKRVLFGSTYDQMKTGDYSTPRGNEWVGHYIEDPGPGEGSITKRMARSRVWEMNDADAAFEMNEKYGYGSIEQTLMRQISGAARDIPIVQRFTDKPEAFFARVMKLAQKIAKEDGAPLTSGQIADAQNAFDHATRSASDDVAHWMTKVENTATNLEYLAHTRNLIFRHTPGASWTAAVLSTMNGKAYLANLSDLAKMWGKVALASGDEKRFLRESGLFLGTFELGLQEGLSHASSITRLDKLSATYSKVSLADWFLNSSKTGIASVVSKNIAEVARVPWADIPQSWKDGLIGYGIGERELMLLSHGIENMKARLDPQGLKGEKWNHEVVSPQSVQAIPLDQVEAYVRSRDGAGAKKRIPEETLIQERFKLAAQVSAMLRNHAEMGTGTPGQAQAAFLYRVENLVGGPNSKRASVLRMALQFKMAAISEQITAKRIYYRSGGGRPGAENLAKAFAGALAISLLAYEVQDLVQGKTPESPLDPYRATEAIGSAGGLGLFMDTLMRALRGGDLKSAVGEAVTGPAIGDAWELAHRSEKLVVAKPGHQTDVARRRLVDLGLQSVPFNSTIYSFDVYNRLVRDQMGEFWQSGYGAQLDHQMSKKHDILGNPQQSWLYGKHTRGSGNDQND